MKLVSKAEGEKIVSGIFIRTCLEIQRQLSQGESSGIAMNIDGATAMIFGELGFSPPLAKGLFFLSCSVEILSHAWEQKNQGVRNKGPPTLNFSGTIPGRTHLKKSEKNRNIEKYYKGQ